MRASWILVLATALACSASLAAQARPNVLFLLADDQRPDTIAAFGNEHIVTPTLDALAGRGFRFSRAYCMGSIHGAVCQPSRAMILSGRTLWRVPMDMAGVTTMPEVFAKAGYETFATGKWHNGAAALRRQFARGGRIMLGGMCDHTKVPLREFDGEDGLTAPVVGPGFSSELFADSVIDFLRTRDESKPFFAWVAFTAPHDPRQPPLEYRERYYRDRPPLPPNYLPQHPFFNGWMTGRDEQLAAWPRTREVIADQLAEYYGLITHLDEQVGRVLAALDETGAADETIVVYTSDHGLAVGSHGLLGKQSLYEHSMGTPMLIAGPGVPHGASDALCYLFDVFPTLCSLAGVPAPQGLEGADLAPVLRGERDRVRDSLFTTYEDSMRAVRDERFKLIRYPRVHHTQLFDLEEDPYEMVNLAERTEHRARVDAMLGELQAWQSRTGDRVPLSAAKREPLEIDLTGRKRQPDRWQPAWIVEKYF